MRPKQLQSEMGQPKLCVLEPVQATPSNSSLKSGLECRVSGECLDPSCPTREKYKVLAGTKDAPATLKRVVEGPTSDVLCYPFAEERPRDQNLLP